jgi:hypothetical protein
MEALNMAKDATPATPAEHDSSGHPPTDGVKSESPGDETQGTVPYHRLQKEVWKSRELKQQLENLTREVAELRTRPQETPETPEAPDHDDDPVGHAEWRADRAMEKAESASDRLEALELENKRVSVLNDLQAEFAASVSQFPAIDGDEDTREFAWHRFVTMKERTNGSASGDEIIRELHSRFESYGGRNEGGDTDSARRNLQGKPKAKAEDGGTPPPRRKAWEKDRDVPQGQHQPTGGKMSFSTKLDRAMRDRTKLVLERMQRSDKRTSGM